MSTSAAVSPASRRAEPGRPQCQVAVVEAAVGPAALAPSPELIIEPALMDAQAVDHPVRLQQPAVGPGRAQIPQDLLVRDPVIRQIRPGAGH